MALTLASNAITFTDNTSLSSGIITAAQLSAGAVQQSFGNTSGAFSFRNKFINGNMRIDQRRNNTPDVTGNAYIADRWACFSTISNTFTVQCLSADGPSGFTSSARVLLNSTRSPGANDIYGVVQRIEAQNLYSLQYGTATAKPVTISFWVKSSVTGTYGARIAYYPGTGPTSTTYVYTYTINQANTWEYKTITIPGNTSLNITSTPNGTGFDVVWNLGTGSSRSTSIPNQWVNGDFHTANGTVSFVTQSPGATWQITGVQLEEGSVATPFEQRPIGLELSLCQRYYQRYFQTGSYWFNNVVLANGRTHATWLIPEMRISPTTVLYYDVAGNQNRVSTIAGDNISFLVGGLTWRKDALILDAIMNAADFNGFAKFNATLEAEL